jgi:predicted short-subunit dehydrogenase-like oxidoreductase (DUF2520 family)
MVGDALPAGIIGMGRVGSAFTGALLAAGHPVVAVAPGGPASHERAQVVAPGVAIVPAAEVVRRADLVFLTVPDSAIAPLTADLADSWRPGQIVVHASGAMGADALEPASRKGALALALHPAMTFTGTSLDVARLRGVAVAIDAAPGLAPLAAALAVELGGEPFPCDAGKRPAYHAALCHAANHLNVIVTQALDLLESAGIADPAAVLGPLLRASLENSLTSGVKALTGPASRGDAETLAAHIAALTEYVEAGGAAVEIVPTYRQLAEATLSAAARAGRISQSEAARARTGLADGQGTDL